MRVQIQAVERAKADKEAQPMLAQAGRLTFLEADPEQIGNDLASHCSTLALKGRGSLGAVTGGKRSAVA